MAQREEHAGRTPALQNVETTLLTKVSRPSGQGHHAKIKSFLDDPGVREQIEEFVEKHGEKKGEKNMTVSSLNNFVINIIFKMNTPTPLLTKPICEETTRLWLRKLNFGFEGHAKAKYKDGAFSDQVLDTLFAYVLPFWEQKVKEGMLSPEDFDGVTDEDDEGWSEQAYEKARLRAIEYSGDPATLPWLAWSHDEACADSMDSQTKAWVKRKQARLKSKGNSGKKVMAAQFVSIIGNGTPRLTDAEYAEAKEGGYKGPQSVVLLMEIGGQDENMEESIEAYEGGGCADEDESELSGRVEAKVSKMKCADLKEELKQHSLGTSGVKADLSRRLCDFLVADAEAAECFLGDSTVEAGPVVFLKGYCKNEHIMAQARKFSEIAKHGRFKRFRHIVQYDNAPSHKKSAEDAPLLSKMAKSDGRGKVKIRDTVFNGASFEMSQPARPDHEEDFCNKGLQKIGFERGYWTEEGCDRTGKVLKKAAMIKRLAEDSDFSAVKTILEEFFEEQPHVSYVLNAKFWCDLQWVEQYWNSVKREVRYTCDYTLPMLKKQFPKSLEAVSIKHIRNFHRRSFELMSVIRDIGRTGDFSRIPGLKKEYKSHRCAAQISLGLASEPQVRKRGEKWELSRSKKLAQSPPRSPWR